MCLEGQAPRARSDAPPGKLRCHRDSPGAWCVISGPVREWSGSEGHKTRTTGVWELGLLGVGGREFPSDQKAEECVSLGLIVETWRTGKGAGSEGAILVSPRDEAKAHP